MNIDKLKEFKEKYIKTLRNDRKSFATTDNYSYNIDIMFKYIEENYKDDFNVKDSILDYIDNMGEGYSAATINTRRSPVRGFITFMYDRGYINENFSNNISVLKEDRPPRDILEPEEIKRILTLLAKELKEAERYPIYTKARNLMLFVFLLYTGTRRSEVVNVKWSDIDLINNQIIVLGKGNKTRIIPLVEDLKQQLFNYRDILEKLNDVGYDVKSEYLFRSERINYETNKKDKPMSTKNVEVIIKEICQKANIEKDITPHSMRHVFASYGIKNDIRIKSLSEILGHSNVSTTLNIYTHEISMKEKKKEMNKINFDL